MDDLWMITRQTRCGIDQRSNNPNDSGAGVCLLGRIVTASGVDGCPVGAGREWRGRMWKQRRVPLARTLGTLRGQMGIIELASLFFILILTPLYLNLPSHPP